MNLRGTKLELFHRTFHLVKKPFEDYINKVNLKMSQAFNDLSSISFPSQSVTSLRMEQKSRKWIRRVLSILWRVLAGGLEQQTGPMVFIGLARVAASSWWPILQLINIPGDSRRSRSTPPISQRIQPRINYIHLPPGRILCGTAKTPYEHHNRVYWFMLKG